MIHLDNCHSYYAPKLDSFFSMGGKGYNSAVECHLDVVEVISSSLIIPKPNVSFSILTCSPAVIE